MPQILYFVGIIGVVILAISVHEAAHAFVAKLCGDHTAAALGRATLNPKSHIDLVGTILVPIATVLFTPFMFGWAKPVPVDYSRLKNQKIDPALVAAAGPFSNFAMALIFALCLGLADSAGAPEAFLKFLTDAVRLNIVFMVFNLLPLPPFDGGRIVATFLPFNIRRSYEKIEPWGMWIVVGLMFLKILTPVILFFTMGITRGMLSFLN